MSANQQQQQQQQGQQQQQQQQHSFPREDTEAELDSLFAKAGLRGFGRVGLSAGHTPRLLSLSSGYTLLISSVCGVLLYLYAAFISKIMPATGAQILDAIKEDDYFCFLLPLMILPTFVVVYLNWFAYQMYQNN